MEPSLRLKSYIKSVEKLVSPCRHLPADPEGVITGGYGETRPHLVEDGMLVSRDVANEWLEARLSLIAFDVMNLVKVRIDQGKFDALVDFEYNLGEGSLKRSTLLKLLNAGRPVDAANEFPKWNKANGKELAGLTARRLLEKAWFTGQVIDGQELSPKGLNA